MKRAVGVLALSVLVLVAYLSLWPVPIDAVAWKAPAAPGYTGVHAANERLAGLNLISLGTEEGPEHIAFGRDRKLYAAVASGRILRMNADGSAQEVFAQTGGRVLGFDFDVAGNGHVIAFTEDGNVVADMQDPSGSYPETTGVTETDDRLYVQNLHLRSIGWLAR